MKRSAWRHLWKSQDIRRKLVITLLLLVIYRLASNVPVPGIDEEPGGTTDHDRWSGWWVDQPAGYAFRWCGIQLLNSGDGCLPIHYSPNYPPAPCADYPRT